MQPSKVAQVLVRSGTARLVSQRRPLANAEEWLLTKGTKCCERDKGTSQAETAHKLTRIAPEMLGSPLPRRRHLHRRLADFVVRFAFETNAMPQFEIEQPPDAIVVVAMLRTMFVEQLLDCFAPEVSAIQGARLKQHLANRFQ